MTDDRRPAVLRAMRAFLGFDQDRVARDAGIAANTLLDAEKGRRLSEKSWAALTAFYAGHGLSWRAGEPGILLAANPTPPPRRRRAAAVRAVQEVAS